MDKSKADWLRKFADAMEADPEGWWKQYEVQFTLGKWEVCASGASQLPRIVTNYDYPIRRRSRTVTRYDRHGKAVELPDLRGNFRVTIDTSEHLAADGAKWLDYFRSLLEANDHD